MEDLPLTTLFYQDLTRGTIAAARRETPNDPIKGRKMKEFAKAEGKIGHHRYNALYDCIKKDDGWFDEYISLCKDYYECNPSGGSLHIVLDDENIEDHHVDWCAGYACGVKDDAGNDLANLMRAMTMVQREKVVSNYGLYS